MITFNWNSNFVTHLSMVDEQHRHLVDLINGLGEQLGQEAVSAAALDELIQELIAYADYHFSEEESLMNQVGIDARHRDRHIVIHRRFIHDVGLLTATGAQDLQNVASNMLDYLVHWLTYHILGQDQNMARQIESVRSGIDAAAAFEAEEKAKDAALEPLLAALNGLLAQLSARNRQLLELNRSLEQRVAERTRALSEANEKLETLSLEDSLTGLSNRRHAMMQLAALWAECEARDQPLAALMIDADNFKEVNDNHGHDAGDNVLIELARTLKHSVRTDDLVFRLGGDEFLVLCPTTCFHGAMKIAEILRQQISDLRIATGTGMWNSSISVGLAVKTAGMQAPEALLKAADDGVYRAKAAGRNCIRTAAPAPAV